VSLERFEFSPKIVDYVCSSLWGCKSRVRTRDGPTEAFDVLSCVRQGDPLAPLIFILVLDALHCGLEDICLLDGHGVAFADGPRLASMGTRTTPPLWLTLRRGYVLSTNGSDHSSAHIPIRSTGRRPSLCPHSIPQESAASQGSMAPPTSRLSQLAHLSGTSVSS
jgi:hypothetical protein